MSEEQLGDYLIGSPSRLALDVLAHKWTLLIVLAMKGGPLRRRGRTSRAASASNPPI
jgi:DNA-binding HxlR family transcriptional regulator